MKRLALLSLVFTLGILPLVAQAAPKNEIHVTPKHDKHDLRRYSPDFDIKLKCKSIRWVIEEPEYQSATFDIKDHRWGKTDITVFEEVTHNTVTQRPGERNTLYVSDVENTDKGFNLKVKCNDD